MKRKGGPANKPSKRPKTVQYWDRDIICLPAQKNSSTICYRRGKQCAWLGSQGLIGKLRLSSTMTEDEVTKEVCSVFS